MMRSKGPRGLFVLLVISCEEGYYFQESVLLMNIN